MGELKVGDSGDHVEGRPTPAQVLRTAALSSFRGDKRLSEQVLDALHEAGMVVGYPNDPEVFLTVSKALDPERLSDDEYARLFAEQFATHPAMRRAVLAALPGFSHEMFGQVMRRCDDFEDFYNWLRYDAFPGHIDGSAERCLSPESLT